MPHRALVTGATGFIGSHLVENLVAKNWDVTCIVREKSRTDFLQNLPVTILKGPMSQINFLEKAAEGQDYIFHLAGRIRSTSPERYDIANRKLTKDLAHACLSNNRNLKRFIFVSSISAAGPSPPGHYSEEKDPPSPTSEYGRSKLRAEEAIQKIWNIIPCTIIRPSSVYGPRQQETELLIKLIRKRIVPLLKDRPPTTSLIYVKDLIKGILQAAFSSKATSQVYYLTDSKGYSWRKIILTVKTHVLKDALFLPFNEGFISCFAWLADILKTIRIIKSYFGRRAWQVMILTPWLFSSDKARRDFGYKACYTLDEGIKETVNYYSRAKSSP